MAKQTTPATQTTNETAAPEAPKVTFLQSLNELAKPVTDLSKLVSKDPLAAAKVKFAANVDESIKAINAKASDGKFFKQHKDTFILVLRNGNTAIPLQDKTTHFEVPNAEAAIKFLNAAKQAAEAGELDKLFAETKRTKKAKAAA